MIPDTLRVHWRTMPNPNEIVLRVAPQFREALVQYAADAGFNSIERACLMIIENHLRADPKTPAAQAFIRSALRESVLTGYAAAKVEQEAGLARTLARLDILAREIYRKKYAQGDLNEADRDTHTVQDMERRGDFQVIDSQRAKSEKKDRPIREKETPLSPAQRDAREFLGPGATGGAEDLAKVIDSLSPIAEE